MIKENCYKSDVYRFDVENSNNVIELDISNIISWDLIKVKMTIEEFKGLADFIYETIGETK